MAADRPNPNAFARYSALGFQMLLIIGGATWGGVKLDAHLANQTPWFTIGLSLAGIGVALWQALRNLTSDSE